MILTHSLSTFFTWKVEVQYRAKEDIGYSSTITLRLNLHHNISDQCLFFLGFLLLVHISPLHTSLSTFFLLEDGCGWCRGCHPAKLLYCRSGVWALPQAFNPSFPQAESKKYRSGRNCHWKLITINTPTIFMLLLFSSIKSFFNNQATVEVTVFYQGKYRIWNNLLTNINNNYYNSQHWRLYNNMMMMMMQFWSWSMKTLLSIASQVTKVIQKSQNTYQNFYKLSSFWRLASEALSSLEVHHRSTQCSFQ